MEEKGKYKNLKILLVSFVISFLFLMICSNNSFLYAFNDNQDINWYITMGNGLIDGKVPYRDLFEQKGPIVYFVFSLFCLFNNPYRVAFFVEVICFTIFLFFSYKLMRKFISKKNALFGIVVTAFLSLTSNFFVVGGGTIEEYCLPILIYMLFCFVEFIHEQNIFSKTRSFIWGILIGVILLTKYSLLVFPAIIYFYMLFVMIKEKKYKEVLNMTLLFIVGVLVVSVPVFIYFIVNNAFKDFFMTYFYNNLVRYTSSVDLANNIFLVCVYGFFTFVIILLGAFLHLKYHKAEKYNSYYFILLFLYFGVLLVTGNFSYYFLPLMVFVPLGVGLTIEFVAGKYHKLSNKYIYAFLSVVLLTLSLVFGNGTLELDDKKSDYIHFQIADDIKSINDENPTLFCYKLWDYGFYNVLGVVPNVKYYANNLFSEADFPEMYEAFRSYIKEEKTQFVLMEKAVYEREFDLVDPHYEYHKTYSYLYYKDNLRSFNMVLVLLIRK